LTRLVRIAVVIPRYFPIYGGAENQCRLLCRELERSGRVKIAFILTKYFGRNLSRQEQIDGVVVHRLGPVGLSRWSQYLFFMATLVKLVLARRHYDVIHSHASGLPGAFPALAGLIARRPVIVKISTNGELLRTHRKASPLPLMRLLWRCVTWLNTRHANMVALNREGYDEAIAAGATRATIIENGVDISVFRPPSHEERLELRTKHEVPPEALVLVFTGRFVQRKGIDILAQALDGLLSNPLAKRLQLLLAGSDELQTGSAEPIVADLARRAGERVRVLPPILPPTEYLHLADGFIFPSKREGMPNALLEAMATGLPCIVSDIEPHRELAAANPHARLLFFRSEDPGDLARVLRQYLVSPDQRLEQTRLDARYYIKTVAERYSELYDRVTSVALDQRSPKKA
jgi:glycosyltransferase involved in cell wall biosynthesis